VLCSDAAPECRFWLCGARPTLAPQAGAWEGCGDTLAVHLGSGRCTALAGAPGGSEPAGPSGGGGGGGGRGGAWPGQLPRRPAPRECHAATAAGRCVVVYGGIDCGT
jgi:hypothetical protein